MKQIADIIEAYRKDGHIVDGLLIKEVQSQSEDEILSILMDANGRDIIATDDEDNLDGQTYEYIGTEDPEFDWDKYFQ